MFIRELCTIYFPGLGLKNYFSFKDICHICQYLGISSKWFWGKETRFGTTNIRLFHSIEMSNYTSLSTVWLQPIWKKVRTWWQIPTQHQSTYLGGPESASIEIPPFGPFLWSKFSKMKIFKNFRIAPKFFFALQYIKNWTKVVPWTKIFVPEKKSC